MHGRQYTDHGTGRRGNVARYLVLPKIHRLYEVHLTGICYAKYLVYVTVALSFFLLTSLGFVAKFRVPVMYVWSLKKKEIRWLTPPRRASPN